MIRQLLAALLGLEGRYISRSGGVGDPLVVVKHYAVDDALQARVDSLLCIANAFSDIQRIQQRNKTDLLAKVGDCLRQFL
ncbi:unnamed protein product [Anisakis simplex]|uniref:Phosphoenolpyruvate carboxylase n=1 Tax=Anisakis simplex TaxID=6269 RepID=A0A0M3JNA7_ANISI|nr:unnamed protein product [Anisakis simplex]